MDHRSLRIHIQHHLNHNLCSDARNPIEADGRCVSFYASANEISFLKRAVFMHANTPLRDRFKILGDIGWFLSRRYLPKSRILIFGPTSEPLSTAISLLDPYEKGIVLVG